jgi:MtrB/PioB family decaheme-associated outer membrane protein
MRDNRWKNSARLPILAAAVSALLAPAAKSEPPDTSQWKCERCPFASGHQAEITAGSTYVSDDAATVGDATGYDEKGGYANVDGSGLYASASHRLSWYAEDLGLDSRIAQIEGGRPGTFDFRLGYRQLPRSQFQSTRTIFTRAADNLLALPAAWTFAPTTAGMTGLAASLASRDMAGERRTFDLGARYLPTSRLRLFADFQRLEQDGTRMLGGSYFTNASLLPRHFDYETDQVDAGIRYDGESGYLQLAYYGSFFSNRYDAIRWENPFLSAPGAGVAAIAESPDSDFQQLALSGSYRAPWLDARISFSAAMGRGEQNEPLLPYTTNPNLAPGPLPVSALDAKVDTTNLALTVTATPLPRASAKFAVRYDERDNKTSQLPWTRVVADSFLSGETQLNVPYGYKRLRMNLSGDYRLMDGLTLAAGYDFTDYDRDFQEVSEQTEDAGWGRVNWRPNEYLEIVARGGAARREIDGYDTALAASLGQNPLLRRFNLAYRYREFGELSVSASIPNRPVTIGAQASWADDSYSSTPLGLTDGEELRVALDFSWAVSDKASVYLAAGYDDIDTSQSGSAAFSLPDWQADVTDQYYSVGGGLRLTGIGDKVDLQFDYSRAQGTTEVLVTGGAGPAQFPDLESTLDSVRARLVYHPSEKLDAILQLRYERLPTEDWALEGVGPATLPTILTLGAAPYDDKAWLAGIGFRYRFGGEEE